jgi:cytosine/adenosine deaminase-related metal-dependent hydrolase
LQLRRLQQAEPATGAAGPRDRGHQKTDVEISSRLPAKRSWVEKRAGSSSTAEAATAEWSRWKAPKTCLGPRRIPTTTGEAHEQELMIFAAVEYDAGASLHAASQPAATSARTHSKAEGRRSLILNLKFNVN